MGPAIGPVPSLSFCAVSHGSNVGWEIAGEQARARDEFITAFISIRGHGWHTQVSAIKVGEKD